jgi:hypothetical protein
VSFGDDNNSPNRIKRVYQSDTTKANQHFSSLDMNIDEELTEMLMRECSSIKLRPVIYVLQYFTNNTSP